MLATPPGVQLALNILLGDGRSEVVVHGGHIEGRVDFNARVLGVLEVVKESVGNSASPRGKVRRSGLSMSQTIEGIKTLLSAFRVAIYKLDADNNRRGARAASGLESVPSREMERWVSEGQKVGCRGVGVG
jgi:hypothetical protein